MGIKRYKPTSPGRRQATVPAEPPVSVVVCTHDRPDELRRCLAALARLEDPVEVKSPVSGDDELMVMVASLIAPAPGAARDLSGCAGGRISWLRGKKLPKVASGSSDQGRVDGPVGMRKRV